MKKNVDEFKKKIQEGPAATPAPPGFFQKDGRKETKTGTVQYGSDLPYIPLQKYFILSLFSFSL